MEEALSTGSSGGATNPSAATSGMTLRAGLRFAFWSLISVCATSIVVLVLLSDAGVHLIKGV